MPASADKARSLLARHGKTRSQAASAWTGDFALPPAVERFYREVGPVDIEVEGLGNACFLPSLAGLRALQVGYRWHGETGKRLSDWPDEWLVVAYEGGDPFIFSTKENKILLAEHGQGAWDPEEIFDDLNTMAACLAALGSVIRGAGESIWDASFGVRPKFRQAAAREIAPFVGSAEGADTVLGLLGWG